MDVDEALLVAEEAMDKAVDYLKSELRGIRTGRASTGLVEFIKVDYYGSSTDLRQLAIISVSDATQILIKPFDASSVHEIAKAIQASGLGLTPVVESKQIRLSLPALSGERRTQLIATVKHKGEDAKVSIRNARRDANKHVDAAAKDRSSPVSEDDIERAKGNVQDLLKTYEAQVDAEVTRKAKEIQEV